MKWVLLAVLSFFAFSYVVLSYDKFPPMPPMPKLCFQRDIQIPIDGNILKFNKGYGGIYIKNPENNDNAFNLQELTKDCKVSVEKDVQDVMINFGSSTLSITTDDALSSELERKGNEALKNPEHVSSDLEGGITKIVFGAEKTIYILKETKGLEKDGDLIYISCLKYLKKDSFICGTSYLHPSGLYLTTSNIVLNHSNNNNFEKNMRKSIQDKNEIVTRALLK